VNRESNGATAFSFPLHAIVGSLGSLARELASGTEVPEEFIFACGLTVLGALCSGELTINVGVEVDPRLYTVLLGSCGKTTVRLKMLSRFRDFCD